MSERINPLAAGMVSLGGLSFEAWRPALESVAGWFAPLITIFGALTAGVYLWNTIVTLKRNRLALREEQEAANGNA